MNTEYYLMKVLNNRSVQRKLIIAVRPIDETSIHFINEIKWMGVFCC